jgi:hypothetical protein
LVTVNALVLESVTNAELLATCNNNECNGDCNTSIVRIECDISDAAKCFIEAFASHLFEGMVFEFSLMKIYSFLLVCQKKFGIYVFCYKR